MISDGENDVAAPENAPAPLPPKPKRKRKPKPKAVKKTPKRKPPKRKNAAAKVRKGKFYMLVHKNLPKRFHNGNGELSFSTLIREIKMTPEAVYKWFRTDRIAAKAALKLIKLSNGKIKKVDMIDFVLR